MALLKTVLVLLACCDLVFSKRYCEEDSDCDVIGDLTCQKSLCDSWGICGCPRGQASRFVGSSLKFQCVSLKKIGESCSTDGTDGICGADNSQCAEGKCACKTGFISVWDGERCIDITSTVSSSSETCSESIGDCEGGNGNCQSSGWWVNFDASPFDGVPITCACGVGQETVLPNEYQKTQFVGRRKPMCAPIPVGGRCIRQQDCAHLTNAECDNNKCVCTGNNIARFDNIRCGTFKKKDDNCDNTNQNECGYGLICGDVCNFDSYNDPGVQKKCVCAPGFTGTTCSDAVNEGSTCYGDAGCKSIGYDALCLDGVCHSGATMLSKGISSILLVMLSLLML